MQRALFANRWTAWGVTGGPGAIARHAGCVGHLLLQVLTVGDVEHSSETLYFRICPASGEMAILIRNSALGAQTA